MDRARKCLELKNSMSTRPLILINNTLRVAISEIGAELQSIRSHADDTEYLWQGDASIWGRRAPILFPIVGKIRENTYTHGGTQYTLPQHGFARDATFELHSSDDTSAHYILSASETTQNIYPFDFDLYVHYKLLDDALHTTYELVHTFGEPLPYAIGTHPAFTLGVGTHTPEIVSSEPLPAHVGQLHEGLMQLDTISYPHNTASIPIHEDTFAHDALIFKNYVPHSWKLLRRDGKSVTVTQNGFSHSALWSKPAAPFVCIEHWSGHADTPDAPVLITQKQTLQQLTAGQVQYTTAMRFA